jgi:hypothetical protein
MKKAKNNKKRRIINMNLVKKLAQKSEQSKNNLLAYTTLAYNLTGNWNKTSLPYHVWQEETRNLKLR